MVDVVVVLLVVAPGRVVVVVEPLAPGSVVLGLVVEVDDVDELDVDDPGAEVVVVVDDDEVVVRSGRLSAREGTARASSAAAVSTAPAPRRVEASDTSSGPSAGGSRTRAG